MGCRTIIGEVPPPPARNPVLPFVVELPTLLLLLLLPEVMLSLLLLLVVL